MSRLVARELNDDGLLIQGNLPPSPGLADTRRRHCVYCTPRGSLNPDHSSAGLRDVIQLRQAERNVARPVIRIREFLNNACVHCDPHTGWPHKHTLPDRIASLNTHGSAISLQYATIRHQAQVVILDEIRSRSQGQAYEVRPIIPAVSIPLQRVGERVE